LGTRATAPETTTTAEALVGAFAREGAPKKALRARLNCHRAGSSTTTQECLLTFSAASGPAESSSGFSFEVDAKTQKVDFSTLRCFVTP
jgi:hypothetical protein